MNTRILLALLAGASLSGVARAEKAPLPVDDLQKQADAIVVATIEDIRVESESSRFEPALGNSDWGIYLTLRLETVEAGNVPDHQMEARCFRIKHRRSYSEYLSPSGHHPIPAPGTRVRVYLEKEDGAWHVVLPNGIACFEGNPQDAIEVAELRSRAYTYLLPMEIWVLLVVVGIPVLICIARWYAGRRHGH